MSYGKNKMTVEEAYQYWFARYLKREQGIRQETNGQFAEYLGVDVGSLENWYNKGRLPSSTTLIKLFSKCSVEFLADIIAIAGLHDKYSITSNQNKPETGISIVAERGRK